MFIFYKFFRILFLVLVCDFTINPGFQTPEQNDWSFNSRMAVSALVGGRDETGRNEFPSIVQLWMSLVNDTNGDRMQTSCGGNIIHSQWILTAAHCFDVVGMTIESVSVVAGAHSLTKTYGTRQQRNANKRYIHPGYNSSSLYVNDIALISLSTPFQLNEYVQVASVADSTFPVYENTPSTIAGWGVTDNHAGRTDILLKAELNIISNADCAEKYSLVERIKIVDSMVCAVNGKVGPCLGDSGGPLYCSTSTEGPLVLCGVISFGVKGECGNDLYPGVFTRVSSNIDWIKGYVPDLKTSGYAPTKIMENSSATKVRLVSLILIPLTFLEFFLW